MAWLRVSRVALDDEAFGVVIVAHGKGWVRSR